VDVSRLDHKGSFSRYAETFSDQGVADELSVLPHLERSSGPVLQTAVRLKKSAICELVLHLLFRKAGDGYTESVASVRKAVQDKPHTLAACRKRGFYRSRAS